MSGIYHCGKQGYLSNSRILIMPIPILILEILPNCPDDFIEKFILLLQKYPKALKAGFSICIDDLPDHYKLKEKVIEWESVFLERRNRA